MSDFKSDSKYKWDLRDIYNTQEDFENDFKKASSLIKQFKTFEGKLNNRKTIRQYYDLRDEYSRVFFKMYVFCYLNHDIDLENNLYIVNLDRLSNLNTHFSETVSFANPELRKMSKSFFRSLINDENFKDRKRIHEAFITKEFENSLSKKTSYSDGFKEIYETLVNSDIEFKSIEAEGKTYEVTYDNYHKLMNLPNREIRKKAYESFFDGHKRFAHTFAKVFIYNLKENTSRLQARNCNSYLESELKAKRIPVSVYMTLVNKVNENIDVMHDYFKLLSKELNVKELTFYDKKASIGFMDKEFNYETQIKIIKASLSVLGKEYYDLLDKAFNEHWIDVYPRKNKAYGAYHYRAYDTHPYVFMNNLHNYTSMQDLAHELGHAIHSYYAMSNQPLCCSYNDTYVTEVASTVNEILLCKFLMKNSKNINDKIFFTDKYIRLLEDSVFRQTRLAEFERIVHALAENNEPLSLNVLNEEYTKILKRHFDGVISIDDNITHEWMMISHFYTPFYVFNYATSCVCANYIATCLIEDKNNMKEKYLELLKMGSSNWPNETLKQAGVDLSKEAPYDILFNDLKEAINNLQKLLELKKQQEKKQMR